jgi:hypothetical protein
MENILNSSQKNQSEFKTNLLRNERVAAAN